MKAARARREAVAAPAPQPVEAELVIVPARTEVERAQDAAARAQIIQVLRRLARGGLRCRT